MSCPLSAAGCPPLPCTWPKPRPTCRRQRRLELGQRQRRPRLRQQHAAAAASAAAAVHRGLHCPVVALQRVDGQQRDLGGAESIESS